MFDQVHAFDVLGDPIRRRILELLAAGELSSGALTEVIQREFGISQPGVSAHLRVLREAGFASVRPAGARRLYAVKPEALHEIDAWLARFRAFWTPHLDALETELARGRRARRPHPRAPGEPAAPTPDERVNTNADHDVGADHDIGHDTDSDHDTGHDFGHDTDSHHDTGHDTGADSETDTDTQGDLPDA